LWQTSSVFFAESTKRIEADTSPSHLFENRFQAVTVEALGRKQLSASGLEEEVFFAIANEFIQRSGECGAKVDVTIGCVSFQRKFGYVSFLTTLLSINGVDRSSDMCFSIRKARSSDSDHQPASSRKQCNATFCGYLCCRPRAD
jgi:hypothetical protein